ncbi:dephospho-CoA kinase [Allosphingosinicella indica]|uniref:Dephospho-CoA kinase n=1 Tax=Allosphingosinicella indica TaxID=941907 RepID=A0A1X7G4G1_9SPHN|nr:dephospho-CoA kinase [Allosphingosinicella indica]SMF63757.1 dephospho-CoA kinase [Allosphingosinicella indica]
MTLILGLTGSIGMGKSTVAAMFADEGVPVFDADAEVHRLQGPEGALVAEIEAHFPGTTSAAGVNRTTLAERVLGDGDALGRLEALIHPAVALARAEFLAAHEAAPFVVLDIPLLFEKGGWDQVDKIAVVSAPADVQRVRVLARPGMNAEKFARILALQLPDAEKRARADFVIPTGGSLGETREAVSGIVRTLSVPRRKPGSST